MDPGPGRVKSTDGKASRLVVQLEFGEACGQGRRLFAVGRQVNVAACVGTVVKRVHYFESVHAHIAARAMGSP